MNLLPPALRRATAPLVAVLTVFASPAFAAEENLAVTAINQFGLSYQKLTPGNSLVSPWSLQQCLGMAYAGANGETRRGMAKALSYPSDDVKLFAGFTALNALPREFGEGEKRQIIFKDANRIFYDEKFKIKEEWRAQVRKNFSAEPIQMKFSDVRATERSINDWVSGLTDRRIPAILPENTLKDTTKMLLVNALSFSMAWDEPFDKSATTDGLFVIMPGKTKTVPFMTTRRKMRYAAGEGFQIAALPYLGKAFQFVVIVPEKADGLAALEAKLTTKFLAACTSLPETEINLRLPRLKMAPPIGSMKETLTKLGMGQAFSDSADFRTMIAPPADPKMKVDTKLKIDDVFHRTFIEVDEVGTKAAAASGVAIAAGGKPPKVPEVWANRPFILLIQDVRTGACLFMGRIVDPDLDQAVKDTTGAAVPPK